MSERVDVVVVGAGAHGSATAWWLAKEGRRVVLLEQFEPGHRRGSSHGGSRIFRVAYDDPWYVELAREALVLWWELEMASGAKLLDATGGLDWGDENEVAAVAKALGESGLDHEMLDPGEARDRWPGFAFDTPVLYSPDAGRLRADLTVSVLHGLVPDVRYGAKVTAIDDGAVRLAGGDAIDCGAVVVTAGAWVTDFAPDLDHLLVTQEQVFHFPPRDGTLWPSFIFHGDISLYGLETLGEGVKVAEHHTGKQLAHPDERDFRVDPSGRARLIDFVRSHLPGLSPNPVTETTCLYTSTPDASFVMERRGRTVIGSACSGHGFKFTPAIGRRLAALAIEALDS